MTDRVPAVAADLLSAGPATAGPVTAGPVTAGQVTAGQVTASPLTRSWRTPTLVAAGGEPGQRRYLEFFAVHIRNVNTRRSYACAASEFCDWCENRGVTTLAAIQPIHVAAYVEALGASRSVPTVKQRLAAIRALFDWLVVGQIVPANPAASVRGPRYHVRRGKTPVLEPDEARRLLSSIDVTQPIGLRDRALIGLMLYSFARIGAALALTVGDVFREDRRLWVRLNEKGGHRHEMPCHHALEAYLCDYLDGCALWDDRQGPVFRAIDRETKTLSRHPLAQANAHAMIRRRAQAAGITTPIGNHTCRATGITAYLRNDGTLETAARMANHASTRTTQLYDRRADRITLAEVERIRL